jgi:glycosyltransferase involved in cell wall biosynthesis
MSGTPLLSVYIPAFNAGDFVREAVESALDNGCTELEVVVVDDGSADGTARIVESIKHPALRLVRHSENLGIALTRQRSVSLLRGRYVALLDADDIAVAGRFEKQINRLEAAEGPDIVGGGVEFFGDRHGMCFFPSSDAQIRAGLLFYDCPLANPTVCMKLAPLREGRIGYSADTGGACDYALWVDAMRAGMRFENLPIVLTRYRRHGAAMMRKPPADWIAQACRVRRRVVETYFPRLDADERDALVDALSRNLTSGPRWLNGIYALSHARMLVPDARRIDAATMINLLENNLMRLIDRGIRRGAADNKTLEMMTETSEHFEKWRAADNGAIDARIMALWGQ